jgi:predicted transcriptional regulator
VLRRPSTKEDIVVDEEMRNELLGLTVDIVAAHVANNRVATNEVSELISQVHSALANLAKPEETAQVAPEPAVPVRSSVKHDYIVCLEDGKKLKMLRRYLRTNYNMTPEEYRTKWSLPRDYPMVAPAYAEQRRGLAQKIGLGRKRAEPALATPKTRAVKPAAKTVPVEASAGDAPAPKRRGRPRKVAAPTEA